MAGGREGNYDERKINNNSFIFSLKRVKTCQNNTNLPTAKPCARPASWGVATNQAKNRKTLCRRALSRCAPKSCTLDKVAAAAAAAGWFLANIFDMQCTYMLQHTHRERESYPNLHLDKVGCDRRIQCACFLLLSPPFCWHDFLSFSTQFVRTLSDSLFVACRKTQNKT